MTNLEMPATAQFHAMTEGTKADWDIIATEAIYAAQRLPDRVMDHLRLLDGDFGGFAIDRLAHSLQTATRAERAGRDDQYVLCALLHDIGDTLGSFNHPDIGAAIVKPFVREEYHWMVEHHGIFQGYYFFEFLGLDPNGRDAYRDNPNYDLTEEFCAEYDQVAFDPNYHTEPLDHFAPLLRDLMAKPLKSIYRHG